MLANPDRYVGTKYPVTMENNKKMVNTQALTSTRQERNKYTYL